MTTITTLALKLARRASGPAAALLVGAAAVGFVAKELWDRTVLVTPREVDAAAEQPEDLDQAALEVGPRVPTVAALGFARVTESSFVRYWARMLRYELNYPNAATDANRLAAHARLNRLWEDDAPQLRKCDRARYAARVVALALIPDRAEVEAAQTLACPAANARRRDVAVPVTRRIALVGYTLYEERARPQDFSK